MSDSTRFPKRSIAESTVNRILNAADDIAALTVKYDTLEEAAQQGLRNALARAGDGGTEYGGIIFKDGDGRFYLGTVDGETEGVAEGTKDNVAMRGRPVTKGDKVAGTYHSHPPDDKHGEFSELDTSNARAAGVPFFIGLANDGSGRVFDPASAPRKQRGSVRVGGTSPGKDFSTALQVSPISLDALLAELSDNVNRDLNEG